jgi:hypothetical protein
MANRGSGRDGRRPLRTMELLSFLRRLRRHPIALVLGVVVAGALAFKMAQGASTTFGVATQRLALDTPKSQLLVADPKGADTLSWRAAVLSEMIAIPSVKADIARGVGTPARSVDVLSMNLVVPEVASPLITAAQKAEAAASERYVAFVAFDQRLPLITIATRAPDRQAAVRLAKVTTSALMAAATTPRTAVKPQGLVVEPIGRPRSKVIVDGPRLVVPVVIFAVLISLWCFGIAFLSRVRDLLRAPVAAAPAARRRGELVPVRHR